MFPLVFESNRNGIGDPTDVSFMIFAASYPFFFKYRLVTKYSGIRNNG